MWRWDDNSGAFPLAHAINGWEKNNIRYPILHGSGNPDRGSWHASESLPWFGWARKRGARAGTAETIEPRIRSLRKVHWEYRRGCIVIRYPVQRTRVLWDAVSFECVPVADSALFDQSNRDAVLCVAVGGGWSSAFWKDLIWIEELWSVLYLQGLW